MTASVRMNQVIVFVLGLCGLSGAMVEGPAGPGQTQEQSHGRPGSDIDANTSGKFYDFYNYAVTDIHGVKTGLSRYYGQVSLVVNVASECGFTDRHYKGLVRLVNIFESTKKFEVLAFPCNQFGGQEPKPNKEIFQHVKNLYDVNFHMFSKINVIEKDVPDAWKYLIEKSGQAPNWNFWKYLVSPEGKVIKQWGPWSDIEEIFDDVKAAVDAAVGATEANNAQGPKHPASKPAPPHIHGSSAQGPKSHSHIHGASVQGPGSVHEDL